MKKRYFQIHDGQLVELVDEGSWGLPRLKMGHLIVIGLTSSGAAVLLSASGQILGAWIASSLAIWILGDPIRAVWRMRQRENERRKA